MFIEEENEDGVVKTNTSEQQQQRSASGEVDVFSQGADGQQLIVEIEDDTPPEDKGRKPLEKTDDGKHENEDEARSYTKGVQKRIGEITHKYHDERRAREAIERELQHTAQLARQAIEHNRRLESQLSNGEAAFSNTTVEKEELAVIAARNKLKKAHDAGDGDAIAEATAEVSAAAVRLENAKAWKSQTANNLQQRALQQQQADVDSQQRGAPQQRTQEVDPNAPPVPDKHALAWGERNQWFGKNRRMTAMVYGIHEELTMEQGLDPVANADEYYPALDAALRESFPNHDWGDEKDTGKSKSAASDSEPAARRKSTSVVAPVSRSNAGSSGAGNPLKVKLTESERRTAERLGLSLEDYAREKLKLAQGA